MNTVYKEHDPKNDESIWPWMDKISPNISFTWEAPGDEVRHSGIFTRHEIELALPAWFDIVPRDHQSDMVAHTLVNYFTGLGDRAEKQEIYLTSILVGKYPDNSKKSMKPYINVTPYVKLTMHRRVRPS